MSRIDIDIKALLDIAKWEPLQTALANVFNITVIVLNYKGTPVTEFSHCADFCSAIRSNSIARRHCFKCAAFAGLESVRHMGPFVYRCSCGIMNAAIPVMIDERYLGSILIGQVRPKDGPDVITKEKLMEEIRSFYPSGKELDFNDLLEKYYLLPEMDYDRILQISNLIHSLISYITQRVVENQNEAQTYEWMLRYAVPPMLYSDSQQPDGLQAIELPTESPANPLPVSPENSIYPAISYVESHRGKMIGMHEMATLCHLSPSYFSKLFLRETGENFTDWVNRRKMSWAKEMLRDTSKSITSIASELGYMDTSYFIKVFKKFEGTTPLVYRQHKA